MTPLWSNTYVRVELAMSKCCSGLGMITSTPRGSCTNKLTQGCVVLSICVFRVRVSKSCRTYRTSGYGHKCLAELRTEPPGSGSRYRDRGMPGKISRLLGLGTDTDILLPIGWYDICHLSGTRPRILTDTFEEGYRTG